MTESTKIEFRYRHISQVRDFIDLAGILFPGNRNQQHAAACILFELKWANGIVPNLAHMESRYRLSRRTLQRARAKLARLGLIEHVSRFNARYGGQEGWRLSGRFSSGLRQLAEMADRWQEDRGSDQHEKEAALLGVL
jgi:hypothetical protein